MIQTKIISTFFSPVEQSANAIISITMDGNTNIISQTGSTQNIPKDNSPNPNQQTISLCQISNQPELNQPCSSSYNETPAITQNEGSYARASRNIAQQKPMPQQQKPSNLMQSKSQDFPTSQLKRILQYNNNGDRVLILMRGAPGSGKTYLAKKIIDVVYSEQSKVDYRSHILSADDYFTRNGTYFYDKSRIPDAHEYTKERARNNMLQGFSPIIIDNTNIGLWDMQPYVLYGVSNGYYVEVVEPHTPWAKKANQLYKKNIHNVPWQTIQRMLDNLISGISGPFLIKTFRYKYPQNMQPPLRRKLPPIYKKIETSMPIKNDTEMTAIDNMRPSIHDFNVCASKSEISSENSKSIEGVKNVQTECIEVASETSQVLTACLDTNLIEEVSVKETENKTTQEVISVENIESGSNNIGNIDEKKFSEIKNRLENMEIVEKEWENGDTWEDDSQKVEKSEEHVNFNEFMPQRNKWSRSTKTKKLIPQIEECQDWSKISMFLPAWGETTCLPENTSPVIETISSSTCMDIGDTEISNFKNPFKIITAIPRDINENHVVSITSKIPPKWMLDKSTTTSNTQILPNTSRCENSERHFIAFRKMFPNVSRADLRHIFDTCFGDVNWAVSIVLDGVNNQQFGTVDPNNVSDTEEESQDLDNCKCLSAYEILPDDSESSSEIIESEDMTDNLSPMISTRKSKKDSPVSETSIQLKRQIEQNIVIPDNHYSNHCLKIRKIKRGESIIESDNKENDNTNTLENTEQQSSDPNTPSTSENCMHDLNMPSTSTAANVTIETSDEDQTNNINDVEQTINIQLGMDLVKQLDQLFGRGDMDYPASVVPRINIPMSVLREINALWIESISHQLEEERTNTDLMIKQDEEFARQVALKEEQFVSEGREPVIPDLDDLLSMDYALFLCDNDGNVDGWRNKQPKDIAAKMTREKLFNLFPEICQDILSELLVAYNNDFIATVEALLTSTGRSHIAEEKNGINKFIMQKDLEKKEKLLQEERQNMSDVEWPLLPTFEHVDMEVVQKYRDQANKHLMSRQVNAQKANDYFRRGMTQVATFYSDFASFHLKKYEQANSLAAASLMQLHASKKDNDTIDLHFLRVREAKEALDLFLDMHIQNLITNPDQNGPKYQTLFFITGRGLHSNGKPRIKPAVKKRLLERGLNYCERNPGLLSAKVCVDTKLSHQMP